MAERGHAAGAHDEMQAGREQHRDQDVDAEHQHIRRRPRQKRQRDQHQEQYSAEHDERARRRAERRLGFGRAAHRRVRAAQQALRARDQHHGHDQKLGDQRELGKVHGKTAERDEAEADAQGLDLGDQHGGDIGSDDRAHAADDDHDEGVGDRGQIHAEIGRLARDLERAAEPREPGADREHGREQERLVDAERAEHLAILRRGAHQAAEARAREHDIEGAEHERGDDDQESVVARHAAAEDVEGAAQAGRPRSQQVVGSPQPQHGVVDDQEKRECGEELEQFRRDIDAAQDDDLDRCADCGHHDRGEHDPAPEPDRAAERRHQRVGDIGPEHIERAVRDIDDARDAENEGEPGRDEEQARGRSEAVEGLKSEA